MEFCIWNINCLMALVHYNEHQSHTAWDTELGMHWPHDIPNQPQHMLLNRALLPWDHIHLLTATSPILSSIVSCYSLHSHISFFSSLFQYLKEPGVPRHYQPTPIHISSSCQTVSSSNWTSLVFFNESQYTIWSQRTGTKSEPLA